MGGAEENCETQLKSFSVCIMWLYFYTVVCESDFTQAKAEQKNKT